MNDQSAVCIGISSGVMLVAQAADPITAFPQWLQVGGAGAAIIGVLWFMYHTTAVSIPRMVDQHAQTVAKIQDKHEETVKEILVENRGAVKEMSDTLRIEMAEERKHHAATCQQIVNGIDQHISRLECQTRRQLP